MIPEPEEVGLLGPKRIIVRVRRARGIGAVGSDNVFERSISWSSFLDKL